MNTGPVTQDQLMQLAKATRDALDSQQRTLDALVKNFISFRQEVRENLAIMDKSFPTIEQDINEMAHVINQLAGRPVLHIIEPDAPEKKSAAVQPEVKEKKIVH